MIYIYIYTRRKARIRRATLRGAIHNATLRCTIHNPNVQCTMQNIQCTMHSTHLTMHNTQTMHGGLRPPANNNAHFTMNNTHAHTQKQCMAVCGRPPVLCTMHHAKQLNAHLPGTRKPCSSVQLFKQVIVYPV